MIRIGSAEFDQLSAAARNSSRLRINRNLHASYEEPFQRLLIAIEPGSYIQPHRHTTPAKPESFVLLRGALAMVLFDDNGEVMEAPVLSVTTGLQIVDVVPGEWHMAVCLQPGTLFYEAKPGPYTPLSDKDFAHFAPAEGSPEAAGYLRELLRRIGHDGAGTP